MKGVGGRAGTVLHLITSLDEGGAQRYLLLHCKHEARWQHVVVYLTGRGLYAPRFKELGIETVGLHVSGLATAIGAHRRLRSLIAELKPRVIVAWMYHAILAGLAAASGRPLIWNIRQTFSGRRREKLYTYVILRILALLSTRASAIVYNSHVAKHSHERLGYSAKNAIVIHNGVSEAAVDSVAVENIRKRFVPDGGCLVVNLGRYHPMKGQTQFADIAGQVLQRVADVTFLAAGAGVLAHRDELVEHIPRALRARFITLDHVGDPGPLLAAANVYLGTSLWGEAYPNSVAEAVAHGCHVLATDVGDTAAIIEGIGTLLSPGDVGGAVSSLRALLESGVWRERRVAPRSRVLSITDATRSYESLYERVAA